MPIGRRAWLCASATLFAAPGLARAELIHGGPPWHPYAGEPPKPVGPGQWHYFTAEEGAAVEALVDRLIPPEPDTPGGRDAGCAVFIDRQLAGAYGSSQALYMRPPFRDGTKSQGPQSPLTPAARYRVALGDLDAHCRQAFAGRSFAQLNAGAQDQLIRDMEGAAVNFPHTSAHGFFELLIKDTQHGFLADPIYGGNRNMCAWKMIGFPGAYYDYRDWIDRHNQTFPLAPTSIGDRATGQNPG